MAILKRAGSLLTACTALALPVSAWAQQQTPAKAPTKPAAKQAGEQQSAVSASKAVATWRGQVMVHLNNQKRAFNAGAEGTSTVAFAIDRSGKVLSAHLAASSGNAALDQEAVALAQRASPLPTPPSDVTGSTINLTVPIRFKR